MYGSGKPTGEGNGAGKLCNIKVNVIYSWKQTRYKSRDLFYFILLEILKRSVSRKFSDYYVSKFNV